MENVRHVQVPIEDDRGEVVGLAHIRLLPNTSPGPIAPLLDLRGQTDAQSHTAPVQLLEGTEYYYTFSLHNRRPPKRFTTDRPEIFRPNEENGMDGRLRTGLYTGTLPVNVYVDGRRIGAFQLEVRSGKLDYLSHYKWMLGDLADTFTELIMRGFAPTETRFAAHGDVDAPTLYQRFAFLRSLIADERFQRAISHLLLHPHREWIAEHEWRPSGQAIPGGPDVSRALARGGRRVPLSGGSANFGPLPSLPVALPVERTHETDDTLPNRFVKHALIRWRDTLADIATALRRQREKVVAQRGLSEVSGVLSYLDELLAQPLFARVGSLTYIPAANQVLHKQRAYRDIYRLYIQFELAATLAWSGGEDVYRAGKKDVAVLYEYWVFLQLAHIVSRLCRRPLPLERLVQKDATGLNVRWRQGKQRVLKGTVTRFGRKLDIEFWFNRTFSRGNSGGNSWTQPLRPDCSLRIVGPGYRGVGDDVWLHFDAKYRVDAIADVFTAPDEDDGDFARVDEGQRTIGGGARPLAEDLLKMHAYRDAIYRSSGAYVIYPGTQVDVRQRYHEILPGLGAFALVPNGDGSAAGSTALRQFLDDVLDHVASQVSQHERHRYWKREVFAARGPNATVTPVQAVPFLSRPPADTRLLIGYVKSARHYAWIRRNGLYNLRADERTGSVGFGSEQLAAQLVLLYGDDMRTATLWEVAGDARLLPAARMRELGYPRPRGELYFCLPVQPLAVEERFLTDATYAMIANLADDVVPGRVHGAPLVTTWETFAQHMGRHDR